MEQADQFRFKSNLLKNRTRGIASMIDMAGGYDCHIDINEILALVGVDGDTPKTDIDEARAELNAIFAKRNHPFWDLNDYTKSEQFAKYTREVEEREQAEWEKLSTPRQIIKSLSVFVLPLVGIYLYWKLIFCPGC